MIGSYGVALPPDCGLPAPGASLGFEAANGQWGSTLRAAVELRVAGKATTSRLEAFWFPADACDADLSDCRFGASWPAKGAAPGAAHGAPDGARRCTPPGAVQRPGRRGRLMTPAAGTHPHRRVRSPAEMWARREAP